MIKKNKGDKFRSWIVSVKSFEKWFFSSIFKIYDNTSDIIIPKLWLCTSLTTSSEDSLEFQQLRIVTFPEVPIKETTESSKKEKLKQSISSAGPAFTRRRLGDAL